MAGFCNSRLRLTIASAVCILACVVLQVRKNQLERRFVEVTEKATRNDFLLDTGRAIESQLYMEAMRRGKAEIKPVVEPVIQYLNVREHGWILTEGNKLALYSAFYDRRNDSTFVEMHTVKVLAMSLRSLQNGTELYCVIRDGRDSTQTVVYQAVVKEIWQRGWDPRDEFYVPLLITCPLPAARLHKMSTLSVSVSTDPCSESTTRALTVAYADEVEEDKKKGVVVCVKGLDFQDDLSTRLVEWLEAQRLFGADKVVFYDYNIPANMSRVIDHYQSLGFVQKIRIDLPPFAQPNIPSIRSDFTLRNRQQKRRHELVSYNDCFSRHIASHRYVLIVDTDELIVPLQDESWSEMLSRVDSNNDTSSSLSIRNVFKFPTDRVDDKQPPYLHTLRHRLRSRRLSRQGEYGKSFTRTEHVLSVFNHFALHRRDASVLRTRYVSAAVALKLHYKSSCPVESRAECAELQTELVDDPSLDRFADRLKAGVRDTLTRLHLLA